MAAIIRAPSANFLAVFLPVVRSQLYPQTQPIVNRIPLLQRLRTSVLPAALLPIPTLLGDLWDGLLNAVPKKKTTHSKKRSRLLASGKGLKDVTALNKCSACGRTKRAHILCPYCVQSIRRWFGNGFKSQRMIDAGEDGIQEARMESRAELQAQESVQGQASTQPVLADPVSTGKAKVEEARA